MPDPNTPHWNSIGAWVATAVSRVLAFYAVVQGLNILVLDEKRWSGPAYHTAMSIPGGPDTWGALLLCAGAVAFLGSVIRHMRWVAVGHTLCAVWAFFFALAFLRAAIVTSTTGTTGVVAYSAIGALSMIIAASAVQLNK
jgi:ABC-type xylose transport system substrate-binding protein